MSASGKIVQILGSVVDVEFPPGNLPFLYNDVVVERDIFRGYEAGKLPPHVKHLHLEVQSELGNNRVRCLAMGSTDGLMRGMPVVDSGAPITIPVGKSTLGRMFNVLGEPIDGGGPITVEARMPILRLAPPLAEQEPTGTMAETGD